jgi:hypothetical protein
MFKRLILRRCLALEIIFECPFGAKCEEIKENKLHRCRLYCNVRGKKPQSEEIIDQWDCSLAWLPMLSVENSQTNRGQTQALESFRNEISKNQREFNATFITELERRKNLELLEEKIGLILLDNQQKKLIEK